MAYGGMLAEVIKVRGYNNDEIEAYVARPAGPGPFPGIVVIHHGPGWDEWTLEFCWKLAFRGFAAISPHLYARYGPGDVDDAAARARAAGGVSDDQVVGDVAGAAAFLRAQPYSNGKIGAIGFCSGGRQAHVVACRLDDIDAVCNGWGGDVIVGEDRLNSTRPVAPITLTANLKCPMLGIFGNEDTNPTAEEVNGVEAELKRLGKAYAFYRYDGAGHAFMATDRHRYRPEQAVDAWGRIEDFFRRHLTATAAVPGARFVGPSPAMAGTIHGPLRVGG